MRPQVIGAEIGWQTVHITSSDEGREQKPDPEVSHNQTESRWNAPLSSSYASLNFFHPIIYRDDSTCCLIGLCAVTA